MKKLYISWMLAGMMMVFGASKAMAATLPDGVEPQAWTIEGQFYDMTQGFQNVMQSTQVAFDGTDVYVQGLSYNFPETWVQGTLDTETGVITFANAQEVGVSNGKTIYLVGSDTGSEVNDITFTYDAEAQTISAVTMFVLETTNPASAMNNYTGFWLDILFYAGDAPVLEPIVAPDDLETAPYTITALRGEDEYTYDMQVGFYGKDVYFQGFTGYEEAPFWAKGTLSADGLTVTIPANQYMGTWDMTYYTYDFFITAIDAEYNMQDIVFNYDAETGTFTTDQTLALNTNLHKLSMLYTFTSVVITKVNMNAATPADPEIYDFDISAMPSNVQFDIYEYDVDANELDADNLYYTIWIEKEGVEQPLTLTAELYPDDFDEDMVEIPFLYNGYDVYAKGSVVYLNQPLEEQMTWTKIGVQVIYYEGEKVGRSNIVWMDIADLWEAVGIEDCQLTANNEKLTMFDLQGRRVVAPTKGIYIINGKKVLLK